MRQEEEEEGGGNNWGSNENAHEEDLEGDKES